MTKSISKVQILNILCVKLYSVCIYLKVKLKIFKCYIHSSKYKN